MKHLRRTSILLILGTVPGLVRSADAWKLPGGEPKLKSAPGVELVSAQCVLCHSLDYIVTQPRLTRDQWKANLVKMQQKFGAPIPAEKVDPLLNYLVANYGK